MTALSTQYCTTMLADAACIIAFAHQLSYQGPKHIVGRQAAGGKRKRHHRLCLCCCCSLCVLEVVPRRFFWRALETKIRKADTKDIHIGALERYWRAHKRYSATRAGVGAEPKFKIHRCFLHKPLWHLSLNEDEPAGWDKASRSHRPRHRWMDPGLTHIHIMMTDRRRRRRI